MLRIDSEGMYFLENSQATGSIRELSTEKASNVPLTYSNLQYLQTDQNGKKYITSGCHILYKGLADSSIELEMDLSNWQYYEMLFCLSNNKQIIAVWQFVKNWDRFTEDFHYNVIYQDNIATSIVVSYQYPLVWLDFSTQFLEFTLSSDIAVPVLVLTP